MDPYVDRLSLKDVETGAAGREAQYLFRMWRENNGLLIQDEKLTRLSPQLMTLRTSARPDDVPQIAFLGRQTPFRRYFPEADLCETQPTALLPDGYRRGISEGYHAAIENEPWYDIQRTAGALGEGKPDLLLERLILRFRTAAGFSELFCLITERRCFQRSTLSDRRYHLLNFQRKLGWHPAYQAEVPAIGLRETRPL